MQKYRLLSLFTRRTLINNLRRRANHEQHLLPLVNSKSQFADLAMLQDSTCNATNVLLWAFDTVNHHILLRKHEVYGIRGVALAWFTNYLKLELNVRLLVELSQVVCLLNVVCPRVQFSARYCCYCTFNDIASSSKLLQFIIFADDTNIFFSHSDLDSLINNVNTELCKIVLWLKVNRLSLNIKKTHYMLFCGKRNCASNIANISMNGASLDRVTVTKFLGVILNENLSWKWNIEYVLGKLSRNVGIIRKLSYSLPSYILRTLYNTLIIPYINCCNVVWCVPSQTLLSRIHVSQKKAARLTAGCKRDAHAA